MDANQDDPFAIPPPEAASEAAFCARCGARLGFRGPEGGCLRCVTRFVLSPDDLFTGEIASHQGPPLFGVRRYGHFEIDSGEDGLPIELGHGAMGVTYRARDTLLNTPVALKVIGVDVAGHPVARARFLREAQSAAQLRHPNVASVFYYGEHDGECFYAMELVEGETLADRVRRDGPFPAATVLEVGLQVARALAAAEVRGVVHRDLKPSNLMLVTGGKDDKPGELPFVKVIDFGLAKAVSASEPGLRDDDTRDGFVGTPAFASPEQFTREADIRIDTRSDIYSLGVTLWYLLGGRSPFAGRTLDEIHAQQVEQPLPLSQLAAVRVPAPMIEALRAMLAIHPRDRLQSARELIGVLENCRRQVSPKHGGRTRRTVTILMALLLLLGVSLGSFLYYHPPTPHPIAPAVLPGAKSIAILPFENRSPDRAKAFFTDGLQDAIAGKMAGITELKVIGSEGTRTYPPGKRDLVKIAQELGVGYLLEGSVQRQSGQVRVTLKLVDAHDDAHVWTKEYEHPLSQVFALQSEITRDVADRLTVQLSPVEKAAIADPPTTDPVAYDLYLRARSDPADYNGPAAARKAILEELGWLQEAVARDPNFVLAYCQIAFLHDELYATRIYYGAEDQAVDHRTLAEVALLKARRLKPEDGRVRLAQAFHFFRTSHDNAQARIELDVARRTLPNDSELEQVAGLIARSQGRWEDAARAFERAAELNPRDVASLDALSWVYRASRRYGDADHASARSLALQPVDGVMYARLFRATGPVEERADLDPLRLALAAQAPIDDGEADIHGIFSLILALYERDADEISRVLKETAHPRIENQGFLYPKAWFEGVAARMRGDTEGAMMAFNSARAEIEKTVLAKADDAKMLSLLAVTDAGLGRKEDAVREGRRACELMPLSESAAAAPIIATNLAVVYTWTGQPDLAFDLLNELAGRGAGINLVYQPSYGDLRLSPLWDPLLIDPRFAALLARLAPQPLH